MSQETDQLVEKYLYWWL